MLLFENCDNFGIAETYNRESLLLEAFDRKMVINQQIINLRHAERLAEIEAVGLLENYSIDDYAAAYAEERIIFEEEEKGLIEKFFDWLKGIIDAILGKGPKEITPEMLAALEKEHGDSITLGCDPEEGMNAIQKIWNKVKSIVGGGAKMTAAAFAQAFAVESLVRIITGEKTVVGLVDEAKHKIFKDTPIDTKKLPEIYKNFHNFCKNILRWFKEQIDKLRAKKNQAANNQNNNTNNDSGNKEENKSNTNNTNENEQNNSNSDKKDDNNQSNNNDDDSGKKENNNNQSTDKEDNANSSDKTNDNQNSNGSNSGNNNDNNASGTVEDIAGDEQKIGILRQILKWIIDIVGKIKNHFVGLFTKKEKENLEQEADKEDNQNNNENSGNNDNDNHSDNNDKDKK